MNWQPIKVSPDCTHFTLEGKKLFDREFIEALKFHAPGFAPVKDKSGSYHVDVNGLPLYDTRYERTFGYYCNRAAVINNEGWFHLDEIGKSVYKERYAWVGNYQEDKCTVRSNDSYYFHIDLAGRRIYSEKYSYAGDFKDGFACVRLINGLYRHIDHFGNALNDKLFLDLGVFHKNYATAKDKHGWFHINRQGEPLYSDRYQIVEPFYNGQALVTDLMGFKKVINEYGAVTFEL